MTYKIKSMKGGWKQTLGYVLSKNGIKEEILREIVKDCICKLEMIKASEARLEVSAEVV